MDVHQFGEEGEVIGNGVVIHKCKLKKICDFGFTILDFGSGIDACQLKP